MGNIFVNVLARKNSRTPRERSRTFLNPKPLCQLEQVLPLNFSSSLSRCFQLPVFNGEAFDSFPQPHPRGENRPSFQDQRWNPPSGKDNQGVQNLPTQLDLLLSDHILVHLFVSSFLAFHCNVLVFSSLFFLVETAKRFITRYSNLRSNFAWQWM